MREGERGKGGRMRGGRVREGERGKGGRVRGGSEGG